MTRGWLVGGSLLALALPLAAARWTGGDAFGRSAGHAALSVSSVPPDLSRPECPKSGEWSTVFKPKYDSAGAALVPSGHLVASGPITDVPEFHDCQQFIVDNGRTQRFISLFAVFARYHLENLNIDSLAAYPGPPGLLIGEVYAYDSAYAALGIEKNFNCLYLRGIGGGALEATMVAVHTQEDRCASATTPTRGRGAARAGTAPFVYTSLPVTRIRIGKDTRGREVGQRGEYDDIPPVARWDWDSVHKRQYIGIRCGPAWCEIHSPGPFASSTRYTGTGTMAQRRVVEAKGWYDEQRLAFPGKGTGPAVVGNIIGTLIPDPALGMDHGTPAGSRFEGKWVPVATVAITGPSGPYAKKLSLKQSAAPNPINKVSLCFWPSGGSLANACFPKPLEAPKCDTAPAEWWAKSEVPGGVPTYRCVIRREHPGIVIPGIARWRWMLKDETYWIRCIDGCCEVQATII